MNYTIGVSHLYRSEATDGTIVMKNVGTLDITGSDRIEKNPRTGAMHLWKTKLRQHRGQLCQVLILTPVILVMVGLFLIPTVFYAQEENLVRTKLVVGGVTHCMITIWYSLFKDIWLIVLTQYYKPHPL